MELARGLHVDKDRWTLLDSSPMCMHAFVHSFMSHSATLLAQERIQVARPAARVLVLGKLPQQCKEGVLLLGHVVVGAAARLADGARGHGRLLERRIEGVGRVGHSVTEARVRVQQGVSARGCVGWERVEGLRFQAVGYGGEGEGGREAGGDDGWGGKGVEVFLR